MPVIVKRKVREELQNALPPGCNKRRFLSSLKANMERVDDGYIVCWISVKNPLYMNPYPACKVQIKDQSGEFGLLTLYQPAIDLFRVASVGDTIAITKFHVELYDDKSLDLVVCQECDVNQWETEKKETLILVLPRKPIDPTAGNPPLPGSAGPPPQLSCASTSKTSDESASCKSKNCGKETPSKRVTYEQSSASPRKSSASTSKSEDNSINDGKPGHDSTRRPPVTRASSKSVVKSVSTNSHSTSPHAKSSASKSGKNVGNGSTNTSNFVITQRDSTGIPPVADCVGNPFAAVSSESTFSAVDKNVSNIPDKGVGKNSDSGHSMDVSNKRAANVIDKTQSTSTHQASSASTSQVLDKTASKGKSSKKGIDQSESASAQIKPSKTPQSQKGKNPPEYVYTSLADVKMGMERVNVFGVVTFCKEPRRTRGTDWIWQLSLQDTSCGDDDKLQAVIFLKDVQVLPTARYGDIVRLHRIKICSFKNERQAKAEAGFSWVIFPQDGIRDVQTSSENSSMSEKDKEMQAELAEWWKQKHTESDVSCLIYNKINEVPLKEYFNWRCQVIEAVQLLTFQPYKCVLLRCWDGTRLHGTLNGVKHDLRVFSSSDYIPDTLLSHTEFLQTLDEDLIYGVLVFDEHASDALKIKPGDFVELRNLHTAVVNDKVEITLHGGMQFHRGLRVLAPDSEEVKELQEDLSTAAKCSTTSGNKMTSGNNDTSSGSSHTQCGKTNSPGNTSKSPTNIPPDNADMPSGSKKKNVSVEEGKSQADDTEANMEDELNTSSSSSTYMSVFSSADHFNESPNDISNDSQVRKVYNSPVKRVDNPKAKKVDDSPSRRVIQSPNRKDNNSTPKKSDDSPAKRVKLNPRSCKSPGPSKGK